jgi:transketolase
MGADTSASVEAKEKQPLNPVGKLRLAGSPTGKPRYGVTVKSSSGKEIEVGDPTATRAAIALMNSHAVNGGAACHWGGGSAFAEIMSALHGILFSEENWYEHYNFINDAGHTENGIYALRANLGFDGMTFEDLKGFRSIQSKLTGHGEAHLNPEGVLVSNGPLGSGFPQAQGLAMGDRALGNSRVTICTISDGASMEGEAKESYAAVPGLASQNKLNPFVLVLSDNNTKLSGRIDADSFDMNPSFETMETLGWKVIKVEDGHNLQTIFSSMEKAVEDAKKHPERPVCVWVKTIKGYGVASTVKNASGGHGFPLKANDPAIVSFVDEIYGGTTPKEFVNWAQELAALEAKPSSKAAVPTTKVQTGISKAAIKATEEGYPVFSVSADLQGSTGIAAFQKTYPDRFIEVGIAESNMVSAGAGLSLAGLIPIVDTFAQFGVTKGNLPLTMANLSQAPVIGLFSHTGFQDAADGASHQATAYFAATAAIPNTKLICCSCSDEAEAMMYKAIQYISEGKQAGTTPDSVLFFVGRENYPFGLGDGVAYDWDKPQILKEGSDVTITATGPMVWKALAAGEELEKAGVSATIINNPFVNQPDVDVIGACVEKTQGRLITIEDHQIIGGMGALLIHALVQSGKTVKAKSLGIPNHFGQSAYTADELYEKHGMTAEAIVATAKELIQN